MIVVFYSAQIIQIQSFGNYLRLLGLQQLFILLLFTIIFITDDCLVDNGDILMLRYLVYSSLIVLINDGS